VDAMANALCLKHPHTHYFEASVMDKTMMYMINYLPSFVTDKFVFFFEVIIIELDSFTNFILIVYFHS
jgi:hypothetical protein